MKIAFAGSSIPIASAITSRPPVQIDEHQQDEGGAHPQQRVALDQAAAADEVEDQQEDRQGDDQRDDLRLGLDLESSLEPLGFSAAATGRVDDVRGA